MRKVEIIAYVSQNDMENAERRSRNGQEIECPLQMTYMHKSATADGGYFHAKITIEIPKDEPQPVAPDPITSHLQLAPS